MADTVSASLFFFSPPADGSRPYVRTDADPATGVRAQNWERQAHEVQIENVRGKEHEYTLDTSGFQYYHAPALHKTFESDAAVEREYYPESIELVKKLTGASRAVIFDHTIRRRRPGEIDDGPNKRQPVPSVHVDQTPQSAVARVHRHLPETDAPQLLKRRFQIINLWRPIHHVALDWPLALADFRTVNAKTDLVPLALVYPDREGETFGVQYNPAQRFKYLRGMGPEDIVLIKCYDSRDDGKTSCFTPHTAFPDPSTPADAPLRESIELRLLVFYDEE